ncbi:MAG: type III-B CRISPR-associated protein Cas10/Cmr2 [Paraglaciecola sp.]|nr:type III-B CRISPR-associated protein Cas10/Cmr2 [Paraglaciecola sp.]
MKQYFHLTIGPVQSFVAQARRSKDLWGGSFLLSWLSAVAIAIVRKQHQQNIILFPVPDDHFMQAVTGLTAKGPKQGGIPNRFKGVTAEVSEGFAAADVAKLVQLAWEQVAELVWQNDLEPFFKKNSTCSIDQTREVWLRQIQNIWEISWVLTENSDVSNLLDRRKNWRNHYPPAEPGDKCMMMAGWQELSGEQSAKARREFWQALRASLTLGKSDLEEGEQLCALGFIKRRFAHYFYQFSLDDAQWAKISPAGLQLIPPQLKGWSFATDYRSDADDYDPTHVPSLPLLAALPFIKSAYEAVIADPSLVSSFNAFADKSKQQLGLAGRYVSFSSIEQLKTHSPLPNWVSHLDGISYFAGSLMAGQSYQHLRTQEIVTRLHHFTKAAELNAPSPFYALLLMDGDSLGSQMSDPKKQAGISAALNSFTREVPAIVQQHDGFLVYAGGDDVLALLPLDTAIKCARAVERSYSACFAKAANNSGLTSTLSGAIQFAHYRTPLMKIVAEAHQLLDDIAKEKSGRDSLAIRINKPGGVHAQWSMPWQSIYPKGALPQSVLDNALLIFQQKSAYITNKLLFKLIESLTAFTEGSLDNATLMRLAAAEYFHSGEQLHLDKKQLQQDMQHIEQLMLPCQIIQRQQPDKQGKHALKHLQGLQLDGLKLIRFLATAGTEQQEELG